MIRFEASSLAHQPLPCLPAWALPPASGRDAAEAVYLAGSALTVLDILVRSKPAWSGAWRQRLALTAAAQTVRLIGRREDEAALRDTWVFRSPDDGASSLGPAGRVLCAWRRLASRTPAKIDSGSLSTVGNLLGLGWDDRFASLPDTIDMIADSHRPAPFAAAAIAGTVYTLRPDAELLAWWLADCVLARTLKWPQPVPLLATQIHTPVFRNETVRGRRIRPGEAGFDHAVCLAVTQGVTQACRLAGTIHRRAERLAAVAPRLRAKGAGEVIELLLNDDAISGSLTTATLSRFGARRLFQRLEAADAVRELSGRSSFRLYGL